METKFGAQGTIHQNIFFTESALQVPAATLGRIKVEISRQNSNLLQVKDRMAKQAVAKGANLIANFKYGQRKHKTWQLIFTFKWDTESWFGEGDAYKVEGQ